MPKEETQQLDKKLISAVEKMRKVNEAVKAAKKPSPEKEEKVSGK